MSGPVLWLRCGKCPDAPNIAKVTGPGLAVYPRPGGRWEAYPRKGSQAEFTHTFTCKTCGYSEKVAGARLDQWWAEFAATRRRRDQRYLGRDR